MFTGLYNNSIDSKNRMIVPLKFRNEFGAGCYLTKGFDKCLYIVKKEVLESLSKKLEDLPYSDPVVRDYQEDLFGNAQECDFDSQGRVVIPSHLMEYAGISQNAKELVTVGSRDRVIVYAKEVYALPKEERRVKSATPYDALSKYGI